MALNAWTLDLQAMADSSRSTAVAARPMINPQSLLPKEVGDDDWALSLAMMKAYHKSGAETGRLSNHIADDRSSIMDRFISARIIMIVAIVATAALSSVTI